MSFLIVIILEARYDQVEMRIGSMIEFRGAAGPIVLWVLCFFTIVLSIKLLW